MLTLQLFLGYEEFPGLDTVVFKNQGEIDTYLSLIFAVLGPQGLVSDAGKSFICGCLVYDSGRRPTAWQAFYHEWLQEPRPDRKMFKRLEADNAQLWKPQRVKFPVVEDFTAWSCGQSKHEEADRQAFNEAMSPHFMSRRQAEADTARTLENLKDVEEATSPVLTSFMPGLVHTKRKGLTFNTGNAKRPKTAPR